MSPAHVTKDIEAITATTGEVAAQLVQLTDILEKIAQGKKVRISTVDAEGNKRHEVRSAARAAGYEGAGSSALKGAERGIAESLTKVLGKEVKIFTDLVSNIFKYKDDVNAEKQKAEILSKEMRNIKEAIMALRGASEEGQDMSSQQTSVISSSFKNKLQQALGFGTGATDKLSPIGEFAGDALGAITDMVLAADKEVAASNREAAHIAAMIGGSLGSGQMLSGQMYAAELLYGTSRQDISSIAMSGILGGMLGSNLEEILGGEDPEQDKWGGTSYFKGIKAVSFETGVGMGDVQSISQELTKLGYVAKYDSLYAVRDMADAANAAGRDFDDYSKDIMHLSRTLKPYGALHGEIYALVNRFNYQLEQGIVDITDIETLAKGIGAGEALSGERAYIAERAVTTYAAGTPGADRDAIVEDFGYLGNDVVEEIVIMVEKLSEAAGPIGRQAILRYETEKGNRAAVALAAMEIQGLSAELAASFGVEEREAVEAEFIHAFSDMIGVPAGKTLESAVELNNAAQKIVSAESLLQERTSGLLKSVIIDRDKNEDLADSWDRYVIAYNQTMSIQERIQRLRQFAELGFFKGAMELVESVMRWLVGKSLASHDDYRTWRGMYDRQQDMFYGVALETQRAVESMGDAATWDVNMIHTMSQGLLDYTESMRNVSMSFVEGNIRNALLWTAGPIGWWIESMIDWGTDHGPVAEDTRLYDPAALSSPTSFPVPISTYSPIPYSGSAPDSSADLIPGVDTNATFGTGGIPGLTNFRFNNVDTNECKEFSFNFGGQNFVGGFVF